MVVAQEPVPSDLPAPDTPMWRQYLSLKERYQKEILFFRMGDFYEMFFDDARVAAEILGIALTSRSKDAGAVPMAGVPVRAVDSYLARLLEAGKRVAICEQTQDPREARGLVEREVVRVVSPGTVTDDKLIDERQNNFILSMVPDGQGCGLAWLDVNTGQFQLYDCPSAAAAAAEIARLSPAECLVPEGLGPGLEGCPELRSAIADVFRTPFPDWAFEPEVAHRTLTEHFRTRTLDGFGCEHLSRGVRAGGGLLRYLQETQKSALQHITRVTPFSGQRHVPLDRTTQRALELTETHRDRRRSGSLIAAFDRASTALGARRLRSWLLTPLVDVDEIRRRQDAVEEGRSDGEFLESIRAVLKEIQDLERISSRLSYGSAGPRDLAALRRSLEALPGLRDLLAGREAAFLRERMGPLAGFEALCGEIGAALPDSPPASIKDGGAIRAGYSAELDELRRLGSEGTRWIAQFQNEEARRTGIPSLKVGFNRVFGYYIEITNANAEKVPPGYIRKQTLKGCERFITPELKENEARVLGARERAIELEERLFQEVREKAARAIPAIQSAAATVAEVDAILTLAGLARERGYVRPLVDSSEVLEIQEGRHPVLELLPGEDFIPNSISLEGKSPLAIITGPNMAGKSTFIRQTAILTLLAQTGSFIPARAARVGVVDRIFTRIGAADDITRGQSTFMVEMHETADILNNATSRSLIILDEVGRGTSTFDGLSLAWAITEHVAERIGARTLFATHYHELTELVLTHPSVRNFNFAVKEWRDEIVFLRKIVEGASDRSYGIHVARLAGIPRSVLERAKAILSNLEAQSLDLHGRPALAPSPPSDPAAAARPLQLDLFRDANADLLKELKRLRVEEMTPLDALNYLARLKERIV
jgi:DNA mismatch repair protein MutS